tara:strand:+ start:4608 stop:5504 length:897 start_codon:yes stop_codon:yes gene_type:complete
MTEFDDKHTIIRDLKIGDTFLSKSNNIGTYIKPLGDDKHLLQGHDGKQYEVPHGKFPVFKQKVTYNNTFSKKGHTLRLIDKKVAYEFIRVYHYLGDAKFFSKFAYGLYKDGSDDLLGVATFSNPQGNVALKGWFGLPNTDQTVLELSRLCLLPELNGTNATSYLLANSIKLLKKEGIRAVITLADDSRHKGSIYQVCNFTYYGLTDKKSDFFSFTDGGKVNPRGATKDKQGVWIPRTQKNRYAYIMDNNLICNYTEQEKPKKGDNGVYDCCGGTHMVTDKRFNINYTCPKCTGKLDIV